MSILKGHQWGLQPQWPRTEMQPFIRLKHRDSTYRLLLWWCISYDSVSPVIFYQALSLDKVWVSISDSHKKKAKNAKASKGNVFPVVFVPSQMNIETISSVWSQTTSKAFTHPSSNAISMTACRQREGHWKQVLTSLSQRIDEVSLKGRWFHLMLRLCLISVWVDSNWATFILLITGLSHWVTPRKYSNMWSESQLSHAKRLPAVLTYSDGQHGVCESHWMTSLYELCCINNILLIHWMEQWSSSALHDQCILGTKLGPHVPLFVIRLYDTALFNVLIGQ